MFYNPSCSNVFSWGWKSPSIELGQFSLNKFFSGGPEVSKNKWIRHLQLFSLIAEQINWVTLKHLSLHEWYFGLLSQFNFCFLCFWPGSCQILTLKSHFHIRDAAWSYHPKFTSLLLAPRTKVKKRIWWNYVVSKGLEWSNRNFMVGDCHGWGLWSSRTRFWWGKISIGSSSNDP